MSATEGKADIPDALMSANDPNRISVSIMKRAPASRGRFRSVHKKMQKNHNDKVSSPTAVLPVIAKKILPYSFAR